MLSMDTDKLTPRHVEVLIAIGRSGSQRDAAIKLFLSEKTIRTHMRDIRWRLSASNTTRALVIALQRGYFTLEDLKEEI